MSRRFLFLSVILLQGFFTATAFGRGGGGCFAEGTPISVPGGITAIENLSAGDKVIFPEDLYEKTGTVCSVTSVEPGTALELVIAGRRVTVTGSHPFQTAPGVFIEAGSLKEGNTVCIRDKEITRSAVVESIRRVQSTGRFRNILVMPGGIYVADSAIVHNKGCFLPDTLIIKADGKTVRISEVKAGDKILAFGKDGKIQHAAVLEVTTREADGHLVVSTDQIILKVTPEHPFYVGNGVFKTIGALGTDDNVFAYDGSGLSAQKIKAIEKIPGPVTVYNLKTDSPNTFFASGIAVHNKGGGGCFPAGTIISTPGGKTAIEQLKPGDIVMGVTPRGRTVETVVKDFHVTRSEVLNVETDAGTLRTTVEHPLLSVRGRYVEGGDLTAGGTIAKLDGAGTGLVKVRQTKISGKATVYNLTVGQPNTFIADGFIVHNKGGGGFRSSSGSRSSGGSGGGGDANPWVVLVFVGLVIAFFIWAIIKGQRQQAKENLDYVFSRDEIERKADKTRKLLEFIAKVDRNFEPGKLTTMTKEVFLKLQERWQSREYEPMRPLMMSDLFAEHERQLAAMKKQHEINKMEDVRVDAVDLVNTRHTHDPAQREFTALITAAMKDYYIDDRDGKVLRGDYSVETFQEFWTFQWSDGKWLLRDIEQTRESDALKEENFFEQFTKTGVEQVYGEAAGAAGAAGPLLEKAVELKTNRIDRLLNFLAKTDSKMWNRQEMIERAREVFMSVMLYEQTGIPSDLKENFIVPQVAGEIMQRVSAKIAGGLSLELRNLCIRKVELVLVRNYADDKMDEYTVRIRAHAQQVLKRGEEVVKQDEDVTPFEEYWSFGRYGAEWMLKQALPATEGRKAVVEDNLDEDSSPEMLKWYYTQERAN